MDSNCLPVHSGSLRSQARHVLAACQKETRARGGVESQHRFNCLTMNSDFRRKLPEHDILGGRTQTSAPSARNSSSSVVHLRRLPSASYSRHNPQSLQCQL